LLEADDLRAAEDEEGFVSGGVVALLIGILLERRRLTGGMAS
jgi:hypothetical protein